MAEVQGTYTVRSKYGYDMAQTRKGVAGRISLYRPTILKIKEFTETRKGKIMLDETPESLDFLGTIIIGMNLQDLKLKTRI